MTLEQKLKDLSEAEETKRGEEIAKILDLSASQVDFSGNQLYMTEWGTKTPLGLFRVVKRIVLDGE